MNEEQKNNLIAAAVEVSRLGIFIESLKEDLPMQALNTSSSVTVMASVPLNMLVGISNVAHAMLQALFKANLVTKDELTAACITADAEEASGPALEKTEEDSCDCPNCQRRRAAGRPKPDDDEAMAAIEKDPLGALLSVLASGGGATIISARRRRAESENPEAPPSGKTLH